MSIYSCQKFAAFIHRQVAVSKPCFGSHGLFEITFCFYQFLRFVYRFPHNQASSKEAAFPQLPQFTSLCKTPCFRNNSIQPKNIYLYVIHKILIFLHLPVKVQLL